MVRARKPAENRGGRRVGAARKAYPNRRDLSATQPRATVPGQGYGERAAQAQALDVQPLPTRGTGGGVPPGPPAQGTPAPGPLTAAPAFGAPTERPGEPLTSGVPMGAGPGPENTLLGQSPDHQLELEQMRPYLPTLELLASQPNASVTTRNWVRRLRGAMPLPQVPVRRAVSAAPEMPVRPGVAAAAEAAQGPTATPTG